MMSRFGISVLLLSIGASAQADVSDPRYCELYDCRLIQDQCSRIKNYRLDDGVRCRTSTGVVLEHVGRDPDEPNSRRVRTWRDLGTKTEWTVILDFNLENEPVTQERAATACRALDRELPTRVDLLTLRDRGIRDIYYGGPHIYWSRSSHGHSGLAYFYNGREVLPAPSRQPLEGSRLRDILCTAFGRNPPTEGQIDRELLDEVERKTHDLIGLGNAFIQRSRTVGKIFSRGIKCDRCRDFELIAEVQRVKKSVYLPLHQTYKAYRELRTWLERRGVTFATLDEQGQVACAPGAMPHPKAEAAVTSVMEYRPGALSRRGRWHAAHAGPQVDVSAPCVLRSTLRPSLHAE
jgi:hypothetical protein